MIKEKEGRGVEGVRVVGSTRSTAAPTDISLAESLLGRPPSNHSPLDMNVVPV